MSEFDEDYVADDFYSLVGGAQIAEMRAIEKQREVEREERERLAQERGDSTMTLMQIAGMKTQKELDVIAAEKNSQEDKRSQEEEAKRKEMEHAKLVNKFPPPDLRHNDS